MAVHSWVEIRSKARQHRSECVLLSAILPAQPIILQLAVTVTFSPQCETDHCTVMSTAEHPVQVLLYAILVIGGILGNLGLLFAGLSESLRMHKPNDQRSLAFVSSPTMFLVMHLALVNLILSLFRNIPLLLLDAGVAATVPSHSCKFFMTLWVMLRSANVWGTLFLSLHQTLTIGRGSSRGQKLSLSMARTIISTFWGINFITSLPAGMYSSSGRKDEVEEMMLVGSTTRPLLGCVWHFPYPLGTLAYAMTTMVAHEIFPIVLMMGTNSRSLYLLRRQHSQASLSRSLQIRAARLVLLLCTLFLFCWLSHVAAVNFYNFTAAGQPRTIPRRSNTTGVSIELPTRTAVTTVMSVAQNDQGGGLRITGSITVTPDEYESDLYPKATMARALLIIARFSASIFLLGCPIVLFAGNRELRAAAISFMAFCYLKGIGRWNTVGAGKATGADVEIPSGDVKPLGNSSGRNTREYRAKVPEIHGGGPSLSFNSISNDFVQLFEMAAMESLTPRPLHKPIARIDHTEPFPPL
uniref:uncharacterized protein n=1 Tax=Myxine glutinosa TaxID=7769 RepID=UPI00358F965D